MATKVNRAATAPNKKGGRRKRKNTSDLLFDTRKKLNTKSNRRAAQLSRHESVARRHDGLQKGPNEAEAPGKREVVGLKTFKLYSSVFGKDHTLPDRYTAEGEGFSPPLQWVGAPEGTAEFALICEELEPVTIEPVILWVLYRIPPDLKRLPEAILPTEQVDSIPSILQGRNSNGVLGYSAPLPPLFDDWHHYRFRLFALDAPLSRVRPGMTAEELLARIDSKILAETELLTRYRRARPRQMSRRKGGRRAA